ncbi:MAG: hypothetical protein EOO75_15610 [Myxococcales bacterium]|nr:MAG: hypothetical protein EOO75_15610 [Myxococcales bacterium]
MSKPPPTGDIDVDVALAHQHSHRHRADLDRSDRCGCFYCLRVYPPAAIEGWIGAAAGANATALCPHCGIDSVIGSASGFPVEREFLARMRQRWFGR